MWIRVSLSSLLPPIHVLWGAAFRWRVSNSGSFSTFETSLSQLPSCYWVTTLDSCTLSLHLAFPPPSTRSPYLRNLLPESVGSVAGRSPEFNPCFEVIRVSIGGKETKQQLLDFRIFLLLLKSLELLRQCNDNALKATSQREAVMVFTQSSPKPAISSHFFRRRESRNPACYLSFIVATA